MTTTIIGYAVADEAFDYSVPQEYAGACETVRIEAGRYPIELRTDRYGRPYCGIQLEGVSTYRGWFGSNTRVDEEHRPARPFSQIGLYEIAACVIEDKKRGSLRFELAENVNAHVIHFRDSRGEKHKTTGLYTNRVELKDR
jgi:hypothetical protein